jgi:hypothetical protein
MPTQRAGQGAADADEQQGEDDDAQDAGQLRSQDEETDDDSSDDAGPVFPVLRRLHSPLVEPYTDDDEDGSDDGAGEDDALTVYEESDADACMCAAFDRAADGLVTLLGHPASGMAELALQLLRVLQPVVDVAERTAEVRGQMGLVWGLAIGNLLQAASALLEEPVSSSMVVMACSMLRALVPGPRLAAEVARHSLLPDLLLRLLCSSDSSLIQAGLQLADVVVLPRRQMQQAVLGTAGSASSTSSTSGSSLVARLVELATGGSSSGSGSGSGKQGADDVSIIQDIDDQDMGEQQEVQAELVPQVVTALKLLRHLAMGNMAVQKEVASLPDAQLRALLGLLGAAEHAVADEAAEALCVLRQGDDGVVAKWSGLGHGVRLG